MAAKAKKSTEEDEITDEVAEEVEATPEPKAAKSARDKSSKSIKAQKPEKLEKAEKNAAKEKEAAEKPVSKKDKAPARKLAGADTGAEAAEAETRQRHAEKTAEHKSVKTKSAHAREYRPTEKYKVGETIFHPVWKEEGKVIEVGKTSSDTDKITVEFDRLGTKRLVCNYTPTPQPEV